MNFWKRRSRTFETPDGAGVTGETGNEDVKRNPFGFADTRAAHETPDVSRARRDPVGFVVSAEDAPASEPVYRTEISFRRDPRLVEPVMASPHGEGDDGRFEPTDPALGHAGFVPHDESGDDVEEDAAAGEPAEERVPFLKRELSLGRRKKAKTEPELAEEAGPELVAVPEPGSDDAWASVPVVESSFGEDVAASGEPVDAGAPGLVEGEEKVPFFRRELSLGRRKKAKTERELAGEAVPEPVAVPEPGSDDAWAYSAQGEESSFGEDVAVSGQPVEAGAPGLVEAEEKVPFFKREVSLGRRKKARASVEPGGLEGPEAASELESAGEASWTSPEPAEVPTLGVPAADVDPVEPNAGDADLVLPDPVALPEPVAELPEPVADDPWAGPVDRGEPTPGEDVTAFGASPADITAEVDGFGLAADLPEQEAEPVHEAFGWEASASGEPTLSDDPRSGVAEESVSSLEREISLGWKEPHDGVAHDAENAGEAFTDLARASAHEDADDSALGSRPQPVPPFGGEITFKRRPEAPLDEDSEASGPYLHDLADELASALEPVVDTDAGESFGDVYGAEPSAADAHFAEPAEQPQAYEPDTIAPVTGDAQWDEAPAAAHSVAPLASAFDQAEAGPSLDEPRGDLDGVDARSLGDDAFAALEESAEASASGRKRGRKQKEKQKKPKRGGGKGKRLVGLKIGASQIAAAVIQETDGRHEVVQVARRSLEAGIVVDGEIRDPENLASMLRAFFEEHRLPKRDVRIGIASNRIGVRTLEIAGIDDPARFDNAVRFKAHEVLPVAVNESVLDYRVIDEKLSESGELTKRVLLVVAPRDQVEPYVEACEAAGLRLAGIDLEALGLLRTFSDPFPVGSQIGDDTATVIVSIGHESTTLLVAGGGACEFTRVFDWGGGTLREAIAAELEIGPAEAASVLRHLSLKGPGWELPALDDVSRARALNVVRARLTPFARELVSSLQFYQTQPDSLGIGELLISGGTAQLEGLDDALNQMIGVSVRVGDPFGRVSIACELDETVKGSIGSLAVPIGLAIDDLPVRSVNLLPKEMAGTTGKRPSLLLVGAPVLALLPVAGMIFMFANAGSTVDARRVELDGLRTQIAALPEPKGPELEPGVVGSHAARAAAVSTVLGQRMNWERMLRDVSRVLPANVWLRRLSAKAEDLNVLQSIPAAAVRPTVGPALPDQPTAVTLEGYTFSQVDVATLLSRLGALSTLKNVTLQTSAEERVGLRLAVRFTIVADLNRAGGAE